MDAGSKMNWVRMLLGVPEFNIPEFGCMEAMRLRSSGWIRWCTSAVAEHSVRICWVLSTGAMQSRQCGLSPHSLAQFK